MNDKCTPSDIDIETQDPHIIDEAEQVIIEYVNRQMVCSYHQCHARAWDMAEWYVTRPTFKERLS